MIIYATMQTIECYGLPDDLHPEGNTVPISAGHEVGNPLQEWGAKLFYFDRRKCLQVCNLASKFTIFLFNLKKKDVDLIGDLIGFYIFELYSDDEEMQSALIKLYPLMPQTCFSKLTDVCSAEIGPVVRSNQATLPAIPDHLSAWPGHRK